MELTNQTVTFEELINHFKEDSINEVLKIVKEMIKNKELNIKNR